MIDKYKIVLLLGKQIQTTKKSAAFSLFRQFPKFPNWNSFPVFETAYYSILLLHFYRIRTPQVLNCDMKLKIFCLDFIDRTSFHSLFLWLSCNGKLIPRRGKKKNIFLKTSTHDTQMKTRFDMSLERITKSEAQQVFCTES